MGADSSTKDTSGKKKKIRLADSAAYFHGSHTALWVTVPEVCSYSDEQERAISSAKRIYRFLGSLSESDLEVGTRSFHIGRLVDDELGRGADATLEGAAQVLRATNAHVCDAAKAALIRALASKPELEARSEVANICISSLWSSDEMQAVAAARTLGEIADPPALPQIRHAMKYVHGDRVRQIIGESIKRIERGHVVDASTSERS